MYYLNSKLTFFRLIHLKLTLTYILFKCNKLKFFRLIHLKVNTDFSKYPVAYPYPVICPSRSSKYKCIICC